MCGEWLEEEDCAMTDAVRELKIRAEILHKKNRDAAPATRRRDCLNQIARQWGFSSFLTAKAMLSGAEDAVEFGTLLYPKYGPTLNAWYADYEVAKSDRESKQGYLLAYKKDFLVVGRNFIESLALDPDDPDWPAMGYDWVKPASVAARTRLYAKLVAGLPRA